MHKHLEKMGEVTFDKIFNQKLGKFYVIPAVVALSILSPPKRWDLNECYPKHNTGTADARSRDCQSAVTSQ